MPVERGPFLRHLPAAAAGGGGGPPGPRLHPHPLPGPRCLRGRAGPSHRSPAQVRWPQPRRLPRAAPVNRRLDAPQRWEQAQLGAGRTPGPKAAPAKLSLHPLPCQADSGCATGPPLQLLRRLGFQWSLFPSQRTGASRRTLARRAPETLREPRFYPIWNLPKGGGSGGRRTGGAVLARREQQLDTRGRSPASVKGGKTTREGEGKQATHVVCAPPWPVGQMPGGN